MTVETEVNGDSKRTNDRVPSLVGSLDSSSCRYNRFCPALAAPVSLVQNIIFTLLVPIAHQLGQAGVLGRLSLCLWKELHKGPIFLGGMEPTFRWEGGDPQGPIYPGGNRYSGTRVPGPHFLGAIGEGIIRAPFSRMVLSGYYFKKLYIEEITSSPF
jgi:hypothetical protein